IRKIFAWCADGIGVFAILKRLNDEGIPPLGRSGQWERSYVRKILNNDAVRGVYQPCKGSKKRVAVGEPIPDYYPRVIDDNLWGRAHKAMENRTHRSGRPSEGAMNPFSGLLYDALDGKKLHVLGNANYKYLVSAGAVQKHKGAQWRTFPLTPFVEALLSE